MAIGIALDTLYSYHAGRVSELDASRVLVALEDIGFELYHWALRWMDVERALREFQEHLGGDLNITLLDGLGSKVEVHEIDAALVRRCIEELAERHDRREGRRDEGAIVPAGGPRGARRRVS